MVRMRGNEGGGSGRGGGRDAADADRVLRLVGHEVPRVGVLHGLHQLVLTGPALLALGKSIKLSYLNSSSSLIRVKD